MTPSLSTARIISVASRLRVRRFTHCAGCDQSLGKTAHMFETEQGRYCKRCAEEIEANWIDGNTEPAGRTRKLTIRMESTAIYKWVAVLAVFYISVLIFTAWTLLNN